MPGPDVGRLLEDAGDYDDDEFDDAGPDAGKPARSGAAVLAAAAERVSAEERADAKTLLAQATKAVSATLRANSEGDALSRAAEEYADERGGGSDDDDDEDDKETAAASVALRVACFRNNLREAEHALDKGASFRQKDRHGWTALHWAASSNADAILKLLIKRASSDLPTRTFKRLINGMASDTGWTPLHVAVVKGSLECIELLLDNPCIKPGTKDALGETAADCIPIERSPLWNQIRRALGVPEDKPKQKLDQATSEEKKDEEEEEDAGREREEEEEESKDGRLGRK